MGAAADLHDEHGFSLIEGMSETRARLSEKLVSRKRAAAVDVKLAPGGIRDIEFLVQCLQRIHGGREAWLRNSATLLALVRLRDKDLLSDSEYGRLSSAYQFLRHLEHRLQFAEDRQTHTLPEKQEELALVARRMPSMMVREKRVRFSSDPPQRSSRVLDHGVQNWSRREW